MVASNILKHKTSSRKSAKNSSTDINSLPQELLIEVIARVASSSAANLINLKTTSKYLSSMSNDRYILEHASIPRHVWPPTCSDGARIFLKLCKRNGNPEALFIYGAFEYFISALKADSGFEKLQKAVKKGHEEANHLYGMTLFSSSEPKSLGLGMKVLNNLLKKFGPKGITECRIKMKLVLRQYWSVSDIVKPNNILDFHMKTFNGGKQENCGIVNKGIENRWIPDDQQDFISTSCDFCMWAHEAKVFCNILSEFSSS